MNPLILIGFDLVFSAVLILLVLYLAWGRVRWVLDARGMRLEERIPAQAPEPGERQACRPNSDVDDMTSQAQCLKKQGLSVEEIAGRLQSPRGEIEMLLALSEMGKTAAAGDREPTPPIPKRKITELLRF